MAYLRKQLERRTFSQDRYDILIKRQKSGKATFKELTELDEIVNRVPDIREKVIMENFMPDDDLPQDNPGETDLQRRIKHHQTIWSRVASLINHIFTVQISGAKQEKLTMLF